MVSRDRPRPICEGCGFRVQLKNDGTLRPHKAWVDGTWAWCPQKRHPTSREIAVAQARDGIISSRVLDIRMCDVPMLDSDRELMRLEFDGFDEMTLSEFLVAKDKRLDELLDIFWRLEPMAKGTMPEVSKAREPEWLGNEGRGLSGE